MIAPDNPMTAMTRDDGAVGDPIPLLREVRETERRYQEVKQQLPEIKRQFLEAKRRYRLFQEIVLLRRELFIRSFRRLEELARVRRLRQEQDSRPIQQSDPEADAERSRLAQNLKESFLKLQKIRELIRDGENLLHRQQRALKSRRQAAAAQVRPDPEMRDNALRLQKLKELYRVEQELLRRQERALCEHDVAAAVQQVQNRDCDNRNASEAEPASACRNSVWKKTASMRNARQPARHNQARRPQQNFERPLQQGDQFRRHRCVGFSAPQDLIARGPPCSAIEKSAILRLEKGNIEKGDMEKGTAWGRTGTVWLDGHRPERSSDLHSNK